MSGLFGSRRRRAQRDEDERWRLFLLSQELDRRQQAVRDVRILRWLDGVLAVFLTAMGCGLLFLGINGGNLVDWQWDGWVNQHRYGGPLWLVFPGSVLLFGLLVSTSVYNVFNAIRNRGSERRDLRAFLTENRADLARYREIESVSR